MTPSEPNTPEDAPTTFAYEQALTWLFAQRRVGPRDPARAAALLDRLGIDRAVPAVHVVGTAGKGTVAAMTERGLRASGRRTGRFLSPHVEDFRERIEVLGTPIAQDDVIAFVDRVRTLDHRPSPAFFEIALALALDAFARHHVEVAVIEAGVGARGDATAALEHVVATVVTNVSADHAATIGPTIADIARDKAAAIRPGVPVVTGATGVARAILDARAAALGAPLLADPPGGAEFAIPLDAVVRSDPARARNQRLAAATLRSLGMPERSVAEGVAAPRLPGRHERFVITGRTVLLDAAHNPASAAALAASLAPGYHLVFGALGRKDGARTLRALAPTAASIVLTEAADGEGITVSWPDAATLADPREAVELAVSRAEPGVTVLIAGSMYLAGRIRPWLRSVADAVVDPLPSR